ncbi:Rad52/22 family double-strand break repair protein [Pseudoalteromonas phage vB_Pun_Y3]
MINNKTTAEVQRLLADPFEAHDIEWRVQQSGVTANGKPWAMVIPYITSRAVQQRLDDVVGMDRWKSVYKETTSGNGYLCGLSVRFSDKWITKWDGSEYSEIEPLKGALSGAMKRAAVLFGIGRYLYSLETEFAACTALESRYEANGEYVFISKKKKQNKCGRDVHAEWFPPVLPDWALPSAKFDKYLVAIDQSDSLEDLRVSYEQAYKFALAVNRIDIRDKAIEIKDRKKAEIEAKEQENSLAANKKFIDWLNTSIFDRIATAENESVLTLNHKHLLQELKGHCKAANVDSSDYVARVNEAHASALNKINHGV